MNDRGEILYSHYISQRDREHHRLRRRCFFGYNPRVPTRPRSYRTEAIVLRRKDWGEADRLLVVLTPQRGKLRLIAKGVRKLHSRKAGHLELYTCSELQVAVGRELDIITQAETICAYRPLREDLLRAAYAAYAAELVDRFTPEAQENQTAYQLLRSALEWFCHTKEMALTMRYYELRLLAAAGFQPQLHRCVVGHEPIIAEDQYFSPPDGGVICRRCGANRAALLPLSETALRCLRYFQTHSYSAAMSLAPRLPVEVRFEVERILTTNITCLLERRPRSLDFLRRLRREMATE